MTAHIRIRVKYPSTWVWELVTNDGHVANVSEAFSTRVACEHEAKNQGLRVLGLAGRNLTKAALIRAEAESASDRRPFYK